MGTDKTIKKGILIFPCGSEIGLEINKSLGFSTHLEVYGASSVSSNHGKYVYKNYIENVPFVDNPDFIDKLNSIIDEYGIEFIFPAHDTVVLECAKKARYLNCQVIGSPYATCQVCSSKQKTYDFFSSKLDTPGVYANPAKCNNFPLFLKPDFGYGSKGTCVAESSEDVKFYLQKNPSLIILEYLPGKEYTVDCFTDRHGVLRFSGARERIRIKNGISVNTRPVFKSELSDMARIINESLKFRGAWFFQAKERANGLSVLLEIAPRIAGSMALYRNLGINFEVLSIFDAMDIDIKIEPNSYEIELDRALINRFVLDLTYKNVYVDLDDTLVKDNKVNPFIVGFLYQCFNKRIKIHLISKHAGNIKETLEKHKLQSLFDNLIHIKENDEKCDYIKEKSSILIDDSFSERLSVSAKLSIPTFGAHNIESLMDWRV